MEKFLKDLTIQVRGVSYKPSDLRDANTGIPLLRANNISDTQLTFDDVVFVDSSKVSEKQYLQDGDIVICASSGSKNLVGKAGVYHGERRKVTFGAFCKVVRPKTNEFKDYLSLFFKSPKYRLEISEKSHGANINNIKTEDIDEMSVLVHNEKAIETICQQLNSIIAGLENKKALLLNLDSLVKSRFMEMFPDWDLSLQKANWIELKALTKIYTGTTPKTEQKDYWNGDIPWVTPAELNSDSYIVSDTERHLTEAGRASKSLSLMPVGTVLLTTRAPIGKVAICGVPMACNQGFKNFECGSELNPTFLYVLLKLNVEWLQSQGTGTTFKEISKTKAEGIKISVPDIESQVAFENFYKLIDKSRFIVQSQIKDLQELLDSKMDEYFGGGEE